MGRVDDLPWRDGLNESPAMRTGAALTDECRRLAELLELDAVGVALDGPQPVSASWSAPQVASIPAPEEILSGGAPGWVGFRIRGGSVFGLLSTRSSPRSEAILEAVGPALLEGLELEQAVAEAATTPPPAPSADTDVEALRSVMDALRRVLASADATAGDVLFAVREALSAVEVFHLAERGGDLEVVSSPAAERGRRIPREIRTTLQALPRGQGLEPGAAHQLGVVLGASAPTLTAAHCREDDPMEMLVVGWPAGTLPTAQMPLVARAAGAALAAVETRARAVDSLLLRERNRWAYEIHDGLTQAVTTAVLELEALGHKIERDPQEALATIAGAKAEIRKALSELRGLLFDLQREPAQEQRTEEPLTKYVQDVVRRWRLPARITVKGDLHHVPKPLLGAAYVVIREGLANAAKHASARTVTVWVGASMEEMVVEVGDSGRGFASQGTTQGRHFGLEMMRKRVAEVGGTLDVQSAPGRGTRVIARLPIMSRGND